MRTKRLGAGRKGFRPLTPALPSPRTRLLSPGKVPQGAAWRDHEGLLTQLPGSCCLLNTVESTALVLVTAKSVGTEPCAAPLFPVPPKQYASPVDRRAFKIKEASRKVLFC